MLQSNVETFMNWIKESDNIVFFGGAGVSTESNIPDFRSVDGLYHTKYEFSPETILSHTFFINKTKDFYHFYRDKMIYLDAKPNITHYKLAMLEKEGKLKGVITQNVDGLHQLAGSKRILELHGSVYRNYCMKCKRFYDINEILAEKPIPLCECGGIIKPDVVLYEEGLNQEVLTEAIKLIENADVLIIAGTSLSVYPAAGLIQYYKKDKLVLINKSATPYDYMANLLIPDSLGKVFSRL